MSAMTENRIIDAIIETSDSTSDIFPAIEQFLGAVDTIGYPKTSKYQASIIEKYIEEVGPHNVVLICTDNASSMKAAADIITDKYPHIYF
jgi:hypothetical protein